MKKFIFAIIAALFISVSSCYAQKISYTTTEFAFGYRNYRGSITWDDWEYSNVPLTIDWDRQIIVIDSKQQQRYVITRVGEEKTDRNGTSIDCSAIDEENLKCTVRLRVQKDGTSQLYVFYSDVAWVYNLVRF